MVQRIRDNRILRAQQHLKQAAIGIKARGIKNRLLHTQKLTELMLQLFVQALSATDKPHRCQPITPVIEARFSSGTYLWVLSQPQIIIGAEIQHLRLTINANPGALGRSNFPLRLIQSRGFNLS